MSFLKFGRLRIKQKLILATVSILFLVSIFVSTFFPLRQRSETKRYLTQKARVIATMMAYNSEAGLSFNDPSAVREVLKGLSEIQDVEFAVVFDKEGKPFAQYRGDRAADVLTVISGWNLSRAARIVERNGLLFILCPQGPDRE